MKKKKTDLAQKKKKKCSADNDDLIGKNLIYNGFHILLKFVGDSLIFCLKKTRLIILYGKKKEI